MPRTTATTGAIPHSVLPTVLDHYTPAIRGEDEDFHDPQRMYTVPPCVYKRGVGPPFGKKQRLALLAEHIRSSELALASINSSSSGDLGASLPLSPRLYPLLQAPPVQDSTVHSHTLCWTYGPVAGTRINSCVPVLPFASTIQGEGSRSTLLVGAGPPGQDTNNCNYRTSNNGLLKNNGLLNYRTPNMNLAQMTLEILFLCYA